MGFQRVRIIPIREEEPSRGGKVRSVLESMAESWGEGEGNGGVSWRVNCGLLCVIIRGCCEASGD